MLGKRKEEGQEFKVTLSYIASLSLAIFKKHKSHTIGREKAVYNRTETR